MAQKNETAVLVLSFLITAILVAAGYWWFNRKSGVDLGQLINSGQGGNSGRVTSGGGDTFADVQNIPTGLFNYGGSTTWAPIRGTIDPAIQQTAPQFRLRYTNPTTGTPGSAAGIRMLLADQLAFSQSSRSVQDRELQQAQQRGYTLKGIPVAIEGIAIAVNPNLNLPGLTLAQIKDIYTGRVTNWSQIGGLSLPITPYSRRVEDGGTVEFFVENLLGGDRFGPTVQFAPTTTQALRQVSNTPGGIYYASAPEVVPQCGVRPLAIGRKPGEFIAPYQEPFVPLAQCPGQRNQLNADGFQSGQYPITRNLFVIVKQNGGAEQQAGETYANFLLTNQGQELLGKAGFVRIR